MEEVRAKVMGFILESLLLGDDSRMPETDDSLVENGVIDSTGILELIEFLEAEFSVLVADDETVPENLDGIDRITAYVVSKRRAEIVG